MLWTRKNCERPGRMAGNCFMAIIVGSLCATVGCSKPGDQPPLASVTGRITMDGEPLSEREVIFSPKEGRASIGLTDENGEYNLMYTFEWEGAMIGSHQVTVTTPREGGERNMTWEETIPLKYNGQTTLTAEVEDKNNVINFDLTSD